MVVNKNIGVFLLSLISLCQCQDPVTPSTSNCSDVSLVNDCVACVAVEGCMFVKYQGESETCISEDQPPATDDAEIFRNQTQCQSGGDLPLTTINPDNTTTTSTTPSTTTSTDTTTSTTTESTTTANTTTSTTTSTTPSTTTTGTTTSTTPSTTPASTTRAPAPKPDGRGHFDGWSFFGGILLTLGIAAIGFVGFKYYKLRSSSGGNYNRF